MNEEFSRLAQRWRDAATFARVLPLTVINHTALQILYECADQLDALIHEINRETNEQTGTDNE